MQVPPLEHVKPAGFSLRVESLAPAEYLTLVWNEFFATRGRGLELRAHFPWIFSASPEVAYLLAYQGNHLAGGLVLRYPLQGGAQIGTIGLVCVTLEQRGRGISSLLLEAAVLEARRHNVAALRLWTNKPGVYARHGFVTKDTALFGNVSRSESRDDSSASVDREKLNDIGIPAFATSATRWSTYAATLTTIEDANGSIVANWSGAPSSILALMRAALPNSFRMNAFIGQPLLAAMLQDRWQLRLEPCKLQMILPLNGERTAEEWSKSEQVSILCRI